MIPKVSSPDTVTSKQALDIFGSRFVFLLLYLMAIHLSPHYAQAHAGLCCRGGRRKLFRRHSLDCLLCPPGLGSCKNEKRKSVE